MWGREERARRKTMGQTSGEADPALWLGVEFPVEAGQIVKGNDKGTPCEYLSLGFALSVICKEEEHF